MTDIIWVHIDALSRDHPVFTAAPAHSPAVFVWDAADMARRGWTLKRCLFVMECVEDLDVEVIEGEASAVLSHLAPARLFMADTPDTALRHVADGLAAEVVRVRERPFSSVPPNTDMGRFFRFWNKARKSALSPTPETAP